MTHEPDTEGVDRQNRQIEQEAKTDADLETVVPPPSKVGGMTTWVRGVIAALAVLLIIFVIVQAI